MRLGGAHILVNAAGTTEDAPVWKMTETQWERVLNVNLKGTFNYIRAVAPIMRAQGAGKIVNVASIEALRGRFGISNYAASKAGVIALTRAAAQDLGRDCYSTPSRPASYAPDGHDARRILEKPRAKPSSGIGEPKSRHVVAFSAPKAHAHHRRKDQSDGGQML